MLSRVRVFVRNTGIIFAVNVR